MKPGIAKNSNISNIINTFVYKRTKQNVFVVNIIIEEVTEFELL
jgi:hypothetical protein